MKQEITQEYLKELFNYKDGFLYWKVRKAHCIQIGDIAGSLHKPTKYYLIKINNKAYKTHRLIYLYHYGYLPEFIDHIDRNRSNNKIENLRSVTKSQNQWNRKPNKNHSSSKYKGISWDKQNQKWKVRIRINGKRINLNYFKSETDAAIAYNKAAIKYYGEYAYLNIIGDD